MKKFLLQPILSLLVGCAPQMLGYNPAAVAEAMKGRVVVVRSGCPEKTSVLGLEQDFQSAFPGLRKQDSGFQMQIHRAFWAGMKLPNGNPRIELDSRCVPSSDTLHLEDPVTGWTLYIDTTQLDPSKLYMARAVIRYVDSSKTIFKESSIGFGPRNTVYDAGPSVETKKALGAATAFGIYDPAKRQFVFSRRIDTKSSTNLLVKQMVLQGNWISNARTLGASTGRSIQDILDLK